MIDLGGTVAHKKTQAGRSVFTSSTGITTGPVICYESVYGEFVTDYVKEGAQFLSVVTNDAWWGDTQGYKQHLSFSRLRAIENRRWVARSANTGISTIINDRGQLQDHLEYSQTGAILGKVELSNDLTFYTIHGDYIARVATLLGGMILIFSLVRKSGLKRK
jgi:apolipoprotein N-acyltransferase